jgi:hypothetical protein
MARIDLKYDMLGNRLRAIRDIELTYDKLGSRLKRIGDVELEYDKLGSRLKRIGDVEFEYDKLGSRLSQIITTNENPHLTGVTLAVVLFFALQESEGEE